MVWAGIWGDRIPGPFFFDGNLNADKYFMMLQEENFPSLLYKGGNFPIYFQQDGAPSPFGIHVRQWFVQQFSGSWIGRRVPVKWPPRSSDLCLLDFYLWGYLKAIVYLVKIGNINQLKQCITNSITGINPHVLECVRQQ